VGLDCGMGAEGVNGSYESSRLGVSWDRESTAVMLFGGCRSRRYPQCREWCRPGKIPLQGSHGQGRTIRVDLLGGGPVAHGSQQGKEAEAKEGNHGGEQAANPSSRIAKGRRCFQQWISIREHSIGRIEGVFPSTIPAKIGGEGDAGESRIPQVHLRVASPETDGR